MPKRKKSPPAAPKAKKPKAREILPSKRFAARTRLYEVVRTDGADLILKNREGVTFRLAKDKDAQIVGCAPEAHEAVSRTHAVAQMTPGRFMWLWFEKADGSDREMLAQIKGPSPDHLSIQVRDLEKDEKKDIGRQFRIDRLRAYMLPDDATYYRVKQ